MNQWVLLCAGWLGPPGMNGNADQVFAMQIHINISDIPVPPPPPPPPLPPPPAPLPPVRPQIEILTVQYGANCNATRAGDYRCDLDGLIPTQRHCPAALRLRCNGKPRCNVTVITPLLDPCPHVLKHLSVTFRCGNNTASPIRNNTLEGEASGQALFLACA